MPCNAGQHNHSSQINELQELNDKLARMLCHTLKELEGESTGAIHYFDHCTDPETKAWWILHKQQDTKRKKEKKERAIGRKECKRIMDNIPIGHITMSQYKLLKKWDGCSKTMLKAIHDDVHRRKREGNG